MVTIVSLWLPILLSAVGVFVLSSIIHMALGYHANDFVRLPDEDRFRAVVGPLGIPPGEYMVPKPGSSKEMQTPEFNEKLNQGPVVMLTVYPNQSFSMGGSLLQWFLFAVFVSVLAAYMASRAVPAGGEYLEVFRFAGTTAFAAYGIANIPISIWYRRAWSTTFKNLLDALLYALLTAGVFGWLWP